MPQLQIHFPVHSRVKTEKEQLSSATVVFGSGTRFSNLKAA